MRFFSVHPLPTKIYHLNRSLQYAEKTVCGLVTIAQIAKPRSAYSYTYACCTSNRGGSHKGQDGKEVRLHIDVTTLKARNIEPGERIEAKVNDQNHVLSILSDPAVTDRRNDKE